MYRKDWIEKWAKYSPDKIAIKEYATGREINYRQLNDRASRLSHWLTHQKKFQPGDRLMVIAEHGIDYVTMFSMAQKTGVTLVPVNYRLTPSEVTYLVQNCEPRMLVIEKKFAGDCTEMRELVEVVYLEELVDTLDQYDSARFDSITIDEDHPLFILYTSGTTGFPKGAIYTHKMLLWNSLNTTQSLEITSNDHTVNCMPSFHTGGWNVLLTPFLHRGASVGIMGKFDSGELLKLMEIERSTLFMGVPTMLKMMADDPLFDQVSLDHMRYFIVGGEAMPVPLINQWHDKGIKIRQGYGMTEVGPNLTSLHHDQAERKRGSIGWPNFYVNIELRKTDGTLASANEVGELCLSGPMVTPGYWNNPEATKSALKDGWFHSGDLAKMDDEGYLYIVDRIKSMFISGGENVYPAEVERVLLALEPIAEAAVVGVPDSRWGEVGKAYLVLTPDHQLSDEEIRSYCLDKLAKFKIPKYFERLKALPKNDSGKIDRNILKANL